MSRKAFFCFILTVTIISLSGERKIQAAGTVIYVSASGNDANPGTKNQPMASMNGAVNKMRKLKKYSGTTVEIRIGDGEYFMQEPLVFDPQDSGTNGAPLIIKAEKDASPVIYGGKKLDGFQKVSEDLWCVKVPETAQYGWLFEQLYVNGKRANRAKSPNSGFFFIDRVSETALVKGTGRIPELACEKIKLFDDGISQFTSFSKEDFKDAVITFYHKWDNTRKHVACFEKDSSAIFLIGRGMAPWNVLDQKTRYTIENYKAALDTCGEWFLDRSGYLYYIPRPGETIENTTAIAPVSDQLVILKGNETTGEKVKNIHFEGLSFCISAYTMPVNGENPAQAAFPVEATVMADYAENISFLNCEISNTGNNAIWFRDACNKCQVEHCYLHDLGAGGVKIGNYIQPENMENLTKNIVVDNNIIRSGGFVFPAAVGVIVFNTSDNQVTHNEIADFRYSGVSVGWVWGYTFSPSKRNKIEFNHIHHIGWGELCDMGGVYCLGESEGTTVSNNVIHHVYSFDYGGWGLYTDEGSTGIVMENNLVYNCKNSGFHQHYGKENMIRNNIFANNMKAQLQATRIEDHLSFTFSNNIIWFSTGNLLSSNWEKINLKTDHNCYWDTRTKDIRFGKLSFTEWKKSGKDVHSIIADPGFVNPSSFDFHIKNKSVIKKTGFKEFDYSKAGVYGTDDWKKLAEFDPAIANLFDEAVAKNENRMKLSPHFP